MFQAVDCYKKLRSMCRLTINELTDAADVFVGLEMVPLSDTRRGAVKKAKTGRPNALTN